MKVFWTFSMKSLGVILGLLMQYLDLCAGQATVLPPSSGRFIIPPSVLVLQPGHVPEFEVGYDGIGTVNVKSSEVEIVFGTDSQPFLTGLNTLVVLNETVKLTPQNSTIKNGVTFSMEKVRFGVFNVSIDGLTATNGVGEYTFKLKARLYLDNEAQEHKMQLYFVSAAPTCSVSVEGQTLVPYADGTTRNSLKCNSEYGYQGGRYKPDVKWGSPVGNGVPTDVTGPPSAVLNTLDTVLDPADVAVLGKSLKCVSIMADGTERRQGECVTALVEGPARILDVSVKSPTGNPTNSFYPLGSVTINCQARGYPQPDVEWNVTKPDNTTNVMSGATYVLSDLSEYHEGNYSFICFTNNTAAGKVRTDSRSLVIRIGATTTIATSPTTSAVTSPTTTEQTSHESQSADGPDLTHILGGVFGGLAALIVIGLIIFCVLKKRREKKSSADEDRPKDIEFDDSTQDSLKKPPPPANVQPSAPPSVGDAPDNSGYDEMQFDNRPGSRKPIASPLETTEIAMVQPHGQPYNTGTLSSGQASPTASLPPYSSLPRSAYNTQPYSPYNQMHSPPASATLPKQTRPAGGPPTYPKPPMTAPVGNHPPPFNDPYQY